MMQDTRGEFRGGEYVARTTGGHFEAAEYGGRMKILIKNFLGVPPRGLFLSWSLSLLSLLSLSLSLSN
jgi:hypothetical protein